MLAAAKRAVEIDREHLAPSGVVGVLDGGEERNAGRVDQPVEAAMGAIDLPQHALPIVLHRDVEHMIHRSLAGPAGQVGRDRTPALALPRRRDGLPNGARRSGDEHDLVVETSHSWRRAISALVEAGRPGGGRGGGGRGGAVLGGWSDAGWPAGSGGGATLVGTRAGAGSCFSAASLAASSLRWYS